MGHHPVDIKTLHSDHVSTLYVAEECSQVLRVPSWGWRSLAISTPGTEESQLAAEMGSCHMGIEQMPQWVQRNMDMMDIYDWWICGYMKYWCFMMFLVIWVYELHYIFNVCIWLVWGGPPQNNLGILYNSHFFFAPLNIFLVNQFKKGFQFTFHLLSIDFNLLLIDFNWFQFTFNWFQFTFNWFQLISIYFQLISIYF